MSENQKNNRKFGNKTKRLCFCALFAAICCACTLISIPLPIGYFNLGDAAVLLSAWALGPLLGCISAAIGSALADLLNGYVLYVPATAIIKACIALCACVFPMVLGKLIRSPRLVLVNCVISAIIGEAVMVGGYFLFESLFLGYGMGALASVPGNVLQGICGTVIGTAAYAVLKKGRALPIK